MKKFATIENVFLLAVFCIPLYLIRFAVFGVPTNVFEFLLITSILLVLLKKYGALSKQFFQLPKVFLLSLALIIFGLITSIIFNDSFIAGLGILKSWFLIPLLFSFALYLVLDSVSFLEKIYQSVFYSSALVGFIALVYKFLAVVTYDNRLSGFYLSPNYLAMYLAPGIFFGTYLLQKSFFENRFSKKTCTYFLLLLFIIVPFYFTYSYGAWLAILGSLFVRLLLTIKNKKYFIASFLFLFFCAAILFFFQTGTQKFSDLAYFSQRSSASSRIIIWKSSILMLEKNPIFGIGPGNFQSTYLEYQKYFPPYLEWAVPEPHNLYLAFWLQTGIIGFIGFLVLLFYIFKTLWKLLRNKKSAALAAPLFGFFLYTALYGLIDTPFWKNDLAFLFWVCIFMTMFLQKYFQDIANKD